MAKCGYESDFSPDGRRFAILDENGLKIWNTTENRLEQQYVPKLHLSRPYTCFVWFQACSGKVSLNKLMYIALGTSKGGVDLYSHASNELDRKLNGNGHQGAVTCICLYDNTTLYTAGEDFQIFEWSLDTCSSVRSFGIVKESIPTSIICLPLSNTLLIGCKRLQQWSLEKKPKIISTLTGHTADISSMKEFHFADTKEEYVATTANNNREIYLWKIGSKTIPTQTFLMEHVGSVVSCSVVESKLTIAAVCKENSGVVHLFVVDDISDTSKRPNKPKVTLIVASDSGGQVDPIPIVAASTSFSKPSSSNILIGYGKSPKISFEDVRYNEKQTKQILERVDPRCQVNRQENFKEMSKVHVTDTNDPATHRNMGGTAKSISGPKTIGQIVDDTDTTVDDKGYSMVEALKQALHNNETTNIRNVLATKDVEVIRSTLKKLPPQYVFSLVDQLTLLTHKKTANVQIAVRWLKLLLQVHASLLIALGKDELNERFGALIGIIDNRTNSLAKLSALTGRLDLLLHQMKRGSDDDQQLHHEHVLEFVEEKSDDEEHTAVNGKSDSDGGASTEEDDVSMGISSNEDSDGNDSDGVSH